VRVQQWFNTNQHRQKLEEPFGAGSLADFFKIIENARAANYF
jgi:hypothetical protein